MDEQIRELRAIRYGIGIATGFILIGIAMTAGDAAGITAGLIGTAFVFTCGLNRVILFLEMYNARKRKENERKASASKTASTHRSGRGNGS